MDSLPKKKSSDPVLNKYLRDLLFDDNQRDETVIAPLFSPAFFTPVEEIAAFDKNSTEAIEPESFDTVTEVQEVFLSTEIGDVQQEETRSVASLDKASNSYSSNNNNNNSHNEKNSADLGIDTAEDEKSSAYSSHHSSRHSPQHHADYAASEWLANGRPSWAEHDFDLLLCRVNGFSLAVPLVTLGQIYEITDELTPIIGQTEWFMGFQPIPGGKVRVVNTALYVMPERYDRESAQPPNYVLTIDGIPWGLSLNSVDQPIRVKTDAVKWRKDRTTQPWMAGVVKDHMCVLLDIPTLGRRLLDSDKKLRQSHTK